MKSILRGVYDFNKVPDQTQWYPNPAVAPPGIPSGQPFNVYNLDPYVWFVHNVQNLNAYGFSLDDDISNPGAGGPLVDEQGGANHAPNTLQIQFSGINRLNNPHEWFPIIPWGNLTTPRPSTSTRAATPTLPEPARHHHQEPTRTPATRTCRYQTYQQINNPGDGQVGAYVLRPRTTPA